MDIILPNFVFSLSLTRSMLEFLCSISFFQTELCHCISLSSDGAIAGLQSDPLTILVYFVDFCSEGVEFCSGVKSNFV